MEAILILDDFDNYFQYFPESNSPCLMPIGDSILVENLISWVKRTCIYSLTLVTNNNNIFNDFQKYKSMGNNTLKIHLIEVDRQSRFFGDYVRNIAISLNLQNDFLLIYGNTFLCHDLDEPIKRHIDIKSKKPNLEATIILSRIRPDESIRGKNEQNIYISSNEGRILCYGSYSNSSTFGLDHEHLKKYKLSDNYSFRLNYDLASSGIIICTNKIVEKFKTCFDFKNMDDYILNVVNDDLECGEIYVYILDKPINSDYQTLSIADYNIYYEMVKRVPFIYEKFVKYNILFKQKCISNNNNNSTITSSWVYNCKIGDNCTIIDSVIFNSEIESGVRIIGSLVIGNCIIKQDVNLTGVVVGNPFRVTIVDSDCANQFDLNAKVTLEPPLIYSDEDDDYENSINGEDYEEEEEDKIKNVADMDITNFENEVNDMISDVLSNPKYVQYSILELKGLRLAYNVQNIHVVQGLLYPIVNWLCTQYPDQRDWESALEQAKIETVVSPFIEEDDKISHFSVFSALLRVCNSDKFEKNNLRFCHVCEALNGAGLLNFDFLPEWYNGLESGEKGDPSLKESRFRAFLGWLSED